MDHIATMIAEEMVVQPQPVSAVITLVDERATVPFIARYRKTKQCIRPRDKEDLAFLNQQKERPG